MSGNPVEKTALLNGMTMKSIRMLTTYTQVELEKQSGVAGQRIQQCEAGYRCFTQSEITRLCGVLGVDEGDFYALREMVSSIFKDLSEKRFTYSSEL
jgi:transcriptional regulator with XRE-family HTH domain